MDIGQWKRELAGSAAIIAEYKKIKMGIAVQLKNGNACFGYGLFIGKNAICAQKNSNYSISIV